MSGVEAPDGFHNVVFANEAVGSLRACDKIGLEAQEPWPGCGQRLAACE